MSEPSQFDRRRHGGRVAMRVPVEVRGIAEDSSPLEESTHTAVVGVMGAMIRTSRKLPLGSEVEVTNRFSQRTAKFRVVWVSEQQEGQPWEIGIESVVPLDDFWGVRFPPRTEPR